MTHHKLPVFQGNLFIRGKIEALTGLHIGGSNEKMQIGGVDLVVIRNPRNNHPYLPGSSIKGKMRHLLEYITGAVNNPFQGQLGNVSIDKDIVRIFGIGAEVTEMAHDSKSLADERSKAEREKNADKVVSLDYIRDHLKGIGLPRLIVRDALPDQWTIDMWNNLGSDANMTEFKAENTIDRLTSAANPRFIERVVEGSKFDFEIVYSAYGQETMTEEDRERITTDVSHILAGLRLMEGSALGKAGTRGYGRVRFHVAAPLWVLKDHYLRGSEEFEQARKSPDELALQPLAGYNDTWHFPTPKA